jgi:hypothetical protein
MASIEPLDPATPVGRLRLLTGDSVLRKDPKDRAAAASYYYEDDALEAFLDIEGGNLKLAAADVLMSFASNEALVSKKIRTETLQTDGPAVAAELRLQAQAFRQEGNAVQSDIEAADGAFFVVDFADPITPFDAFELGAGVPWH